MKSAWPHSDRTQNAGRCSSRVRRSPSITPYALVTADDPPVWLGFGVPPALGENQKNPTHTSNFGVKLQEKCKSVGVECEFAYPGAPDVKHALTSDFLIEKLKAPTGK